jgi:hypothetical protein
VVGVQTAVLVVAVAVVFVAVVFVFDFGALFFAVVPVDAGVDGAFVLFGPCVFGALAACEAADADAPPGLFTCVLAVAGFAPPAFPWVFCGVPANTGTDTRKISSAVPPIA